MLTVNNVTLTNETYAGGFSCAVEFQVGDRSYNKTIIELSPEATRRVVELAVGEAHAAMVLAPGGIAIKGEATADVVEDAAPAAPESLPSPVFDHAADAVVF